MAFWQSSFRVSKACRETLLLAPLLASLAYGYAQAADSLYTVAKISVDVTAKDAVAARDMGMAEATPNRRAS